MHFPTEPIVTTVIQALDEIVAPSVRSEEAKIAVDLCLRLLRLIGAEARQPPDLQTQRDRKGVAILQSLEPLGVAGATAQAGDTRLRLETAFTEMLQRRSSDASLRTRQADAFETLLNEEKRFLVALDPEAADGIASVYQRGHLSRDAASAVPEPAVHRFTADLLQSYFRSHGDSGEQVTVEHLHLVSGGFNKETLLVDVVRGATTEALVIRRDLPVAATDMSVVDEFPLLRAVFEAGLKVAEPLWLETSRQVIGQPFLVARKVAGNTDIAGWRNRAECLAMFADDLAAQLALLHRVDVGSLLPADAPICPPVPELVGTEIERWWSLYRRRREPDESSPLFASEHAWLLANIPGDDTRPVIVHADIGFHNLLTVDGRIEAILDWEFAHLGDPQEDLNYIRPFLEPLGIWEAFVAGYREHGGCAYREDQAGFWAVWQSFRNGLGCVGALAAFRSGRCVSPDAALKLAVAGLNFGPRYAVEAAEQVLKELRRRSATPAASSGVLPS
ncbi:MAG: hypothetical protein JWQ90_3965 [Hydrocarboniphaga sp.]|uniref:phosphotransferase family protein n=1 Tax=Hydrocarboniphaga sp. TaxID=2033016 RepID=UPI00260E2C87|nr:phosphotransferase family protein [Hydrocarboniphaga sp.]MDB5971515.1 hypothetical protein [Hydrocarboniphaga sp.]